MTALARAALAALVGLSAAASSQPADLVRLDESFSAASLADLTPTWETVWLGATSRLQTRIESGNLIIETAPRSPALVFVQGVLPTETSAAFHQVWAAAFETEMVVTSWGGSDATFGLTFGASQNVLLSPSGGVAFSGCNPQGCWDAAQAANLFGAKEPGAPLRILLRYAPISALSAYVSLSVDGQAVLEAWIPILSQNAVGVLVGGGSRVGVDRLVVRALPSFRGDEPSGPLQTPRSTWIQSSASSIRKLELGQGSDATESSMVHRDGEWWTTTEGTPGRVTLLRRPSGSQQACIRALDEPAARCLDYAQTPTEGEFDATVCEDLYMSVECVRYRRNGTGEVLRDHQETWVRAWPWE